LNKHRRISQICGRGRSNKIIKAGTRKQCNVIKFTKITIGIASSRRSEKEEGTRKRMEKKK